MDKKEDRRFYWEVKNFVNGNPPNPSQEPKADLKSAVKSVLEQNKIYQTSTFDAHSNAVDIGKNAVGAMANIEKRSNPSSVAYTKNKDMGSFQNLSESVVGSLLRQMGRGLGRGTQQLGRVSRADLSKYVVPGAAAGAIAAGAGIAGFETGETLAGAQPSDDLDAMRRTAEEQGGVPQSTEEDEIAAMRRKAEEVGGVPQTSQEDEELMAMRKKAEEVGGGTMSTTPSTPVPTPAQPTTSTTQPLTDQERYLEARKEYWRKRNVGRRQEAEENLARTQFGKPTTAYQAGSMAANRLRQQRAAEGGGDWSEEKIARMAAKETELRFRTPEQREAKKKENEAVVASLAKAADEIRAREASSTASEMGTKTAPKTYRI